jgi:hypothetical protein
MPICKGAKASERGSHSSEKPAALTGKKVDQKRSEFRLLVAIGCAFRACDASS